MWTGWLSVFCVTLGGKWSCSKPHDLRGRKLPSVCREGERGGTMMMRKRRRRRCTQTPTMSQRNVLYGGRISYIGVCVNSATNYTDHKEKNQRIEHNWKQMRKKCICRYERGVPSLWLFNNARAVKRSVTADAESLFVLFSPSGFCLIS